MNRKYFLSVGELVDRMSICQQKEWHLENKEAYAQEIRDICHDIDEALKEDKIVLDAKTIRAIVVLALSNCMIWQNEANYRKGIKEGNNLGKSHSLNSIRCTAKNKIQELFGGRKDYKIDVVMDEYKNFIPSDW